MLECFWDSVKVIMIWRIEKGIEEKMALLEELGRGVKCILSRERHMRNACSGSLIVSVDYRPAALASPGNLLEMYNFRRYPNATDSESTF